MIKVLFFARLREELGIEGLQWPWQAGMTLAELLSQLQGQGEPWASCLAQPNLLAAVNQAIVDSQEPVADGDEVAFFPPVTGG
ncbi:molybdopterin converting factor subunit 1 [Pokkaliibacter plantistimulans]|uniref:Molybdopterin synthase sulfur carrier subunit n=1 Tax=Proteobacteria bacterium 228 TaxID=2083153 RepID=A0A2S5KRL7_9PROT|nr:molybdopterin converting factor subunit 1 [Pokkaliibacter plantistimulans]PPC77408.1 molybdopterin converting factor subunit 1 [Pokkaliibacter plantistimulans]